MKLSESIKTISELKAHASEIVRDASKNGKTFVITQNGKASVVVQDIKEYERREDRDALLQIIALGTDDILNGRYKPINQAFKDLDKKIKEFKKSSLQNAI